MKILAALVALCVVGVACARPVFVKESSRIPFSTIAGFGLQGPVAIDGDDAIVIGSRGEIDESGYSNVFYAAFLFHRSGTSWTYVRKLAEGFDSGADDVHGHIAIAMKEGIAALSLLPLSIFERQPDGQWLQATIAGGGGGSDPADDIEIDNGRIFWGAYAWGGVILERNAAGQWAGTAALFGDSSGDGDNSSGDNVSLSGPWAAVANPYNWDDLPAPAITTYNRVGAGPAGWPQTQRLVPLAGHSFGDMAIRGEDMFIEDTPKFGLAYYHLDSNRQWAPHAQLRTPGDLMSVSGQFYGGQVKQTGDFIFHRTWDYDRGAAVVQVFQGNINDSHFHVATLADSRGGSLGAFEVSGRRLIATGGTGALVFDLPASYTTKSLFQATFETVDPNAWTQFAGSQWSVVQSGNTHVFRQASAVGDAGASFDYANWASQSIQADVTPTAFNGADRWVGLATRRSDESNYYYVTLRSSGIVALKRNKNGAFANLASASFPVTLNRTYRLRLESFGAHHRVYIDGLPVLAATDTELIAGHPALLTSRAAADFDNVLVSPSATTTIFAADTGPNYEPPEAGAQPAPWTYSGTGQWYWIYDTPPNIVFRQTSTTGDARAAVNPANPIIGDQIVEARARIKAYGTGSGEKWIGVMARYADPANFTYLSLRSSNRLALRRVEQGRIVEIGSVALPVALNTWYDLRLEVVQQNLRAYLNGKLLIEVVEHEYYSQGTGGLVTYKAAADFDDYREVEP
jgi:hypothetical protein